jgi:hypothetical protein
MIDVTVRLHYRRADGRIEDAVHDIGLEAFAGFLPAIGDTILDPSVTEGLDRREPRNRKIWTVVQRMFNPRDLENYVALVIEERSPLESERDLLPSR